VYALLGGVVVAAAVLAYYVRGQPELAVWHLADLDEEFTAVAGVADFQAYLALEDRLFAQLDERVYARVPTGPEHLLERYSRGSHADPGRWPASWNRSFELRTDEPAAGVLLLHGLSDSPYSLRSVGRRLHESGAAVLGLRVPGHGTAPSGLKQVRWEDMAAAVALAARHLSEKVGAKPLYVLGYSNGGALAVEYALSSLADSSLPRPAGIVLLSAEIGVTELAVLARWQARLGRVLGVEKLAWSSIDLEYDPFKYNSFAVNAGALAHALTGRIQDQLTQLGAEGRLVAMPRILAFQSAVDATVSAPALVEHLFARLPPAGHELVLFDINREAAAEHLIAKDPRDVFRPMLAVRDRGYDLTVVTNASDSGPEVVARNAPHGSNSITETALDERWPREVYSLAHIALPFRPDDPVYGGPDAAASPGVKLGDAALFGERGVLRISRQALLRMHWNPFYGYVESRILRFMGLPEE
jgi:alpha-beta hydrolase superfamily lysophospholipase